MLVNHFREDGKPLFLLNGNQRGVGKTLLARTVGLVLDGEDPTPLQHTDDEDEMGSRLGARLRSPGSALPAVLR